MNLESNLRSAARENFRLYPECYAVKGGEPTEDCINELEILADAYGAADGFWDAGMTPEQTKQIVESEFRAWIEQNEIEEQ